MRLLEHEAKQLLAGHGLDCPRGHVVTDATTPPVMLPAVIKAQVPVGGRGKAGGVVLVTTDEEYAAAARTLLGGTLKGYPIASVLVEEVLPIAREYYLALTIDRQLQSAVLLAHHEGGIEVESARDFLRIPLNDMPSATEVAAIADYLDFTDTEQLQRLLERMWAVFTRDALLVEINPLVVTADGQLVCADAKVVLDDTAAFRYPEWGFADASASSQFVVLDPQGTIASMANGAGLAMATIDAIKAAGAIPANFFDVGGGTSAEGMQAAFGKIASLSNVKAVVINIFAGITRCDQVAEAIIAAKAQFSALPALFIRLSGTNAAEGQALLEAHGIAILPSLSACVEHASKEASRA